MESACLTDERFCPVRFWFREPRETVFYNITTLKFHVFLSGYLRHLDASKVLDFDGFEMAAPILYPKVVLVHHARSGQSKCLIWAWGQSRESLCHLPVRHNFWNLNHDKISAVIREGSFKVKTPFKTLKFLSLLLPFYFSIHISPFCQLS